MIYTTKQYLTDKKEEKKRKSSEYFFLIILPHMEKLVDMATPMHILRIFFTKIINYAKMEPNKS